MSAERAALMLGARLTARRIPRAYACAVVEELLETFRSERAGTGNPVKLIGYGFAIAILKAYLKLHCAPEPAA